MKTDTKTILLAAAAMAGLMTGCATHEQKKSCTTCTTHKGDKAKCGSKADCSSKQTCRAQGNCGAKKPS